MAVFADLTGAVSGRSPDFWDVAVDVVGQQQGLGGATDPLPHVELE